MRFRIFLLIASFLWASCKNDAPVHLQLNLEKGQTYSQTSSTTLNTLQKMNGQEVNILMNMNGKIDFVVKDIVDSVYLLDVSYKQISLEMQFPQGKIQYSSEKNDPQDIFSQILTAMTETSFEMRMDRTGKVLEIRGIDNLLESLVAQAPLPEEQRQQVKSQLEQSYGEDAFIGNMEMITSLFPGHAVKPGDQWKKTLSLSAGFASEVQTTFTYKGKKNGAYQIDGESTLQTLDKNTFHNTNGLEMRYDLRGEMQSELSIDEKSCWIKEAKIHQDVQGKSIIKANPQLPEGMEIPMTMKSDMTITGQ